MTVWTGKNTWKIGMEEINMEFLFFIGTKFHFCLLLSRGGLNWTTRCRRQSHKHGISETSLVGLTGGWVMVAKSLKPYLEFSLFILDSMILTYGWITDWRRTFQFVGYLRKSSVLVYHVLIPIISASAVFFNRTAYAISLSSMFLLLCFTGFGPLDASPGL